MIEIRCAATAIAQKIIAKLGRTYRNRRPIRGARMGQRPFPQAEKFRQSTDMRFIAHKPAKRQVRLVCKLPYHGGQMIGRQPTTMQTDINL